MARQKASLFLFPFGSGVWTLSHFLEQREWEDLRNKSNEKREIKDKEYYNESESESESESG